MIIIIIIAVIFFYSSLSFTSGYNVIILKIARPQCPNNLEAETKYKNCAFNAKHATLMKTIN